MFINWQAGEGEQMSAALGVAVADVHALSNGEHRWTVTILSESGATVWATGYECTRAFAVVQAEGSLKRAHCATGSVPTVIRVLLPVAA